jgi:hypothetical protein
VAEGDRWETRYCEGESIAQSRIDPAIRVELVRIFCLIGKARCGVCVYHEARLLKKAAGALRREREGRGIAHRTKGLVCDSSGRSGCIIRSSAASSAVKGDQKPGDLILPGGSHRAQGPMTYAASYPIMTTFMESVVLGSFRGPGNPIRRC